MVNNPNIRFAGFSDEWAQYQLGSIYEFSKGKGLSLDSFQDDGFPAIAYGHLYTQYSEVINEVMLKSVDKGNKSKKGDILFPGSSTVPNGTCQANALMIDDIELGGDVIIARAREEKPYAPFVSYMINSQRTKLFPITTGTTITHMYGKDIAKLTYSFPALKEQQKIGSIFSTLDHKIGLEERQISLLKDLKKGYLQKMFPKQGATEPEIRFKGFTDAWEQRKFKDILKTHSIRLYLSGVSENGEYEVIQQGDKPIAGYSDGEPFTDYNDVTLFGDHTVSVYKPKSPFFVATDGVKILSADNFKGDYMYTTLERYKPEPQGYKRHFTILKNQDVWFTTNMEEQQKIGIFFKQLDEIIARHQRKLDLLKDFKKGLSQQMFV